MSDSFQEKIKQIQKKFSLCNTAEERYNALIEMGRQLAPFPVQFKVAENLVRGCQSTLYLHAIFEQGKVFFSASADALISAGLAALLIFVYSGETPETILTSPPQFIVDLQIAESLSLNRSNGLSQIHLRMKQEALKTYSLKAT